MYTFLLIKVVLYILSMWILNTLQIWFKNCKYLPSVVVKLFQKEYTSLVTSTVLSKLKIS